MALITQTYGLYIDSGGITEYVGVYDLQERVDGSDNPTDKVLYLMSIVADPIFRVLQASSDPGVDNLVLSVVDNLAHWIASTAYIVGDMRQPTVSNGFRYKCITAGTSGASAPTWPTSGIGSTVTDGTAVWTLIAPKHATTEITLALSSGALATNTPGASLALGNTVNSGVANALPIYIRIITAVNVVSNNTATPEIRLDLNNPIELEDIS
jgi:hypothetical protein